MAAPKALTSPGSAGKPSNIQSPVPSEDQDIKLADQLSNEDFVAFTKAGIIFHSYQKLGLDVHKEEFRKLCGDCNIDMGSVNWDDYVKKKQKNKIIAII